MNTPSNNIPLTEKINPHAMGIDEKSTIEILNIINDEDKIVASAVEKEIPNIAKAVKTIVKTLKREGRVIYVGAGSSGRIGVLDAVELPVTFGIENRKVRAILAGGNQAMFKAVEMAEDGRKKGYKALIKEGITMEDVVIGLSASGRTPFVLGALERANEIGAKSIIISSNSSAKAKNLAQIFITPKVGPEIIAGSTRLKSATAQKLILNMISTASMIKLGKVYGPYMVDLSTHNTKLIDRATRMIAEVGGIDQKEAECLFNKAKGNVKAAILMAKTKKGFMEVKALLDKANAVLRDAIKYSEMT